jgi:hypothetical protein
LELKIEVFVAETREKDLELELEQPSRPNLLDPSTETGLPEARNPDGARQPGLRQFVPHAKAQPRRRVPALPLARPALNPPEAPRALDLASSTRADGSEGCGTPEVSRRRSSWVLGP